LPKWPVTGHCTPWKYVPGAIQAETLWQSGAIADAVELVQASPNNTRDKQIQKGERRMMSSDLAKQRAWGFPDGFTFSLPGWTPDAGFKKMRANREIRSASDLAIGRRPPDQNA
jgi:hypothetical protein